MTKTDKFPSNKQAKKNNNLYDIKTIVSDGVYTSLLVIFGMIKIPSIIPGTEFQISAPYAVCLASLVGFIRYFCIGICASFIQLILGTHTIYNVVVAMVFRVVAGLIIQFLPFIFSNNQLWRKIVLCIAGPLGTIAARFVLSLIINVPVLPLLAAAVPGMIFTSAAALILDGLIQKNGRFFNKDN